jgi:hypothetical protein
VDDDSGHRTDPRQPFLLAQLGLSLDVLGEVDTAGTNNTP